MNLPRQPRPSCVAEILNSARDEFLAKHTDPHLTRLAHLETQVLLAHVLECDRSWLIAHDQDLVNAAQRNLFQSLVTRRINGEPIAYLTGYREFWSLELKVSPEVLIPRPETELLIETVLKHIAKPKAATMNVADLGTGSGAIALALATELPNARIIATDTSIPALTLAAENAQRHALNNIDIVASDWCSALGAGQFQIICANPPYIADSDPHLKQGDLRYEPRSALSAGSDGLDDLRQIISQAKACLDHNGMLLVEHGADQGPPVRKLFAQNGYGQILSLADLAGHERISMACKSPWKRNQTIDSRVGNCGC